MTASPGRLAAARTLARLEQRGGHADDVFARFAPDLRGRERRLGWALVLGVERRRSLLDHQLAPHLTRPVHSLDPAVRATLRCAAMQLLAMDRVPDRAAIHQAVEVARHTGAGRAAGLVNAALRSMARDPERAGEALDPAVVHSMPPWLLERMTSGAAAAFNEEPMLALRPRRADLPDALREAGFAAEIPREPVTRSEAVLVSRGDPTELPGWRDGWFAVQDAASQAVVSLVEAARGELVLDACAAPGGKALALADAVGETGTVVALDVSSPRLARMDAEARRLGRHNVVAEEGDAAARLPAERFDGGFDRVLVDAPCSALGTLRRHPELRWQRGEGDASRLVGLQGDILAGASTAVRPGGRLVYAVCSFLAEEGPRVVERFLAESPHFGRVPIDPRWGRARTDAGELVTWPDQGPWDAFYAAAMVRQR